ncbi:MAG: glycogen debranching enzyme N-terminal domain-containing protein, partial [Myxococcota bacterium]
MDENDLHPEHGDAPVRVVPCRGVAPEDLLHKEWIVANGLGGYASGTIVGAVTRRYHSYLVASLPAPLGRVAMLNHLSETVRLPDGRLFVLGGLERVGRVLELHGLGHLVDFRLEAGLPVWRFELDGFALERRVVLPHLQNTVHVTWRLVAGDGTLRLKLRPAVHFRAHEAPVNEPLHDPYTITAVGPRYEIRGPAPIPPLRVLLHGDRGSFTLEEERIVELLYRVEESRGYEAAGELWSPGVFRADLRPGRDVTLVASTEAWDTLRALSPEAAEGAERERRRRLLERAPPSVRTGPGAELVLAADQFLMVPGARAEEAARARAAGDEARSVIAGYHWFTDWGRDTMISLEGLT